MTSESRCCASFRRIFNIYLDLTYVCKQFRLFDNTVVGAEGIDRFLSPLVMLLSTSDGVICTDTILVVDGYNERLDGTKMSQFSTVQNQFA